MSSDFDWQTTDDQTWFDDNREDKASLKRSRRRWPWFVLLAAVLLSVAGFLVYRRFQEQAAATQNRIRQDILATVGIIERAALTQDAELSRRSLSARDPGWTEAQKALIEQGIFFDRPWLNLTYEAAALDQAAVSIAPDLRAAELLISRTYTVQTARFITATIVLEQPVVYRKGNAQWLYAPPLPEFWGHRISQSGDWLTLVYYEREAEVARRLAGDLNEAVEAACATLADLNCDQDLHLTVRLSPDPETLLAAVDLEAVLASGWAMDLPALSLTGLPTDEAGYQALLAGYSRLVVAAAVTRLVDYDCCQHGLYYRSLLDQQLAAVGLLPFYPVTPDYDELLDNNRFLIKMLGSDQPRAWSRPVLLDGDAVMNQQVKGLVTYLTTKVAPEASVAAWQRALSSADSYVAWYDSLAPEPFAATAVTESWLDYVYGQVQQQQAPPPISFPDQQIEVVCLPVTGQEGLTTYQLDPATQEWSRFALDPPPDSDDSSFFFSSYYPLPGGRGYAQYTFREETSDLTLLLWQDGELESIPVVPLGGDVVRVHYNASVPLVANRYLFVQSVHAIDNSARQWLVDLDSCDRGRCGLISLPDFQLVWSPQGDHTLIVHWPDVAEEDAQNGPRPNLYRGNSLGQERELVAAGGGPFWFDEAYYGYVRLNEQEEPELVAAAVSDDKPIPLITIEALYEQIPEAIRPEQITMGSISTAPQGHRLLIALDGQEIPGADVPQLFYFAAEFDPVTQTLGAIRYVTMTPEWSFGHLSPDGHWLFIADYSSDNSSAALAIYDLQQPAAPVQDLGVVFSLYAWANNWSADGGWLLYNDAATIRLVAPEYAYEYAVPQRYDDCGGQVFWSDNE